VDGRCVIVCGARCDGVFDDSAYLWVVATQLLDKYPITFLRHSRRGLELLRANFTHLHGLVLADFGCSVRWLEWLGFKVSEPMNGIRAFELRQI